MTVWHIEERRKIPYGARRGGVVACVSALLLLAAYSGAVEAAIIDDDVSQADRDSRDPFLFRPALSRVGLNANACGLESDRTGFSTGAEQASENTEYEADLKNLAYLSSGRLFQGGDSPLRLPLPGEDSASDRMVWEPNDFGFDIGLPIGTFSDFSRIKVRVENIGNCLKYMQYLVNSISVIFNFTPGNSSTAFGRNTGGNPYIFVFATAGNTEAKNSASAAVISRAGGGSKSAPKFAVGNTLTSILNENRGKVARRSGGRVDVSIFSTRRTGVANARQEKPRRKQSMKDIIKGFLTDIFSQVYTYVLMAVVFVFGLFLKSRV